MCFRPKSAMALHCREGSHGGCACRSASKVVRPPTLCHPFEGVDAVLHGRGRARRSGELAANDLVIISAAKATAGPLPRGGDNEIHGQYDPHHGSGIGRRWLFVFMTEATQSSSPGVEWRKSPRKAFVFSSLRFPTWKLTIAFDDADMPRNTLVANEWTVGWRASPLLLGDKGPCFVELQARDWEAVNGAVVSLDSAKADTGREAHDCVAMDAGLLRDASVIQTVILRTCESHAS